MSLGVFIIECIRGEKTRLFILLFFLPSLISGQKDSDSFRFEKLPSELGLYNTGVNEIEEDHRGFLWLATWAGLARYDGYSIKMYRQEPNDANGLKSNKISHIFEDSKKQSVDRF